MKQNFIPLAICLCCCLNARAQFQQNDCKNIEPLDFEQATNVVNKKVLNFFIISPPKKGKLDLGARYNIARGEFKSIFRRKKFVAFVAKDMQTASTKVQYHLHKSNATIGTLWFDSHGSYKKGYAVFLVGKDEFNYKSVRDSAYIKPLLELAPYTDENSKLVIGSCYGGATFCRKSLYSNDTLRMNGDSLMMGLGKIFTQSTIYASESWVMTKPGLFMKKPSVAGHPTRRLYKDIVYRPAWENVGKWNEYSAAKENFCAVNPVTMDAHGNLLICSTSYAEKDAVKNGIEKNLKKLKPGLLKVH